MQAEKHVYLARLPSALITYDTDWLSSVRTEQKWLSLLQVVAFIETSKYNCDEECVRFTRSVNTDCFLFGSDFIWLGKERRRDQCRPYYTEVILLELILLNLWSYFSTRRIHKQVYSEYTQSGYKCAQGCSLLVSMFIFNILYCSLQLGIPKIMDCLSHATA